MTGPSRNGRSGHEVPAAVIGNAPPPRPAYGRSACLPPLHPIHWLGVEPAQASSGAGPAQDTVPAPIGPGMPREQSVEPAGNPAPEPARPTGSPVGRSQGLAPAPVGWSMASGWWVEPVGSAPPAGTRRVGADWGQWWGTFQGAAGARFHVWWRLLAAALRVCPHMGFDSGDGLHHLKWTEFNGACIKIDGDISTSCGTHLPKDLISF
jgi:hypothetical protein